MATGVSTRSAKVYYVNERATAALVADCGDPGGTLVCSEDICVAFSYANHNVEFSRHCKGVAKHYPLKTENECVIRGPDVYRLIMGSTLPDAERYEAWYTRKTHPPSGRLEVFT